MESVTHYFMMGGPFMYAVLGGCSCAAIGALAGGIAYGWKRWAGMLIFVLLSFVPVCSGLAGTIMGIVNTHKAAEWASPDMKQELLDTGTEISMYTTYLALGEFCVCLGGFIVLAMISSSYFRRRQLQKLMEED